MTDDQQRCFDQFIKLRDQMSIAVRAYQANIAPFAELHRQFREQQAIINTAAIQIGETIHSQLARIQGFAVPLLDAHKQIASSIGPILLSLHAAFQGLPDRMRDALKIMGENGWYIDWELPIPTIIAVAKGFSEGMAEESHEVLCQHYEERLDTIKENLIRSYPHRSLILSAAIEAHQEGKYYLAIPVFLSQADGICNEILGTQLYKKRNGIPATAQFIDSEDDRLITAMLHPLAIPLPISANIAERFMFPGALNRHAVLHGEDVTYGSQLNSYRAISLLFYVASVLRTEREETTEADRDT